MKIYLKKISILVLCLVLFVVPLLSFGQSFGGSLPTTGAEGDSGREVGGGGGSPSDFKSFVYFSLDILNSLTGVVAALSLLVFFWGMIKFLAHGGSEDNIAEGKKLMLWGVIILFVMISFWGIILFLKNTIFSDAPFVIPQIP